MNDPRLSANFHHLLRVQLWLRREFGPRLAAIWTTCVDEVELFLAAR